ncbi:MurR/RpiR family transcriptional regulator [Macrococcus armenti]|uniref:MurR/RpiR family transcriptional regulator n=1 Tax=Macrococcus armenti TaxID=2875764 RepID=UPI001CC94EAB|nr:MurR/RpiR family transcriptional regulator [Macrococcus armenti]UBH08348.1 MurR/RpiR family transcriptional regulator [Macrococcus armenti]UBH10579.1 MurR/RpiR family transcriptional regulator [Macrococcus armenti]UBH15116.1 MurR/RpiR family transcriptional regulator [Macrococcus armenti]UBH17477.1 MurR/RpiR family transcriptional regulator [Macrococcus armenti]UBH19741.1 MurR/RpiR family transcriptional regulator [Macrococcus armenti]
MYSVLGQITKMYDSFTPVEKRIADVVIEYPEKVVNLPIKEIASLSNTSEAAIVRFSKRLGLSGIKVVKVELARELHTIADKKVPTKIELTDDKDVMKEKVFNNTIQALYNTEKVISAQVIDEAAQAITSAKRVMIFGVGNSRVVATDLHIKFMNIDQTAILATDLLSAITILGHFEAGDVLFITSETSKNKIITDICKYAKEKGIKIILLSQKFSSPAIRMADIVLAMGKEENEVNLGYMTVRTAQLTIVDVLYLRICAYLKDTVISNMQNLNETRKITHEQENL